MGRDCQMLHLVNIVLEFPLNQDRLNERYITIHLVAHEDGPL